MVLPSNLVAEFEKIAQPNTDMPPYGIETCGILAGRLVSPRCGQIYRAFAKFYLIFFVAIHSHMLVLVFFLRVSRVPATRSPEPVVPDCIW